MSASSVPFDWSTYGMTTEPRTQPTQVFGPGSGITASMRSRRTNMRNPYFQDVLDLMAEVHDSKNEDYASDEDPFSNFTGVAQMTDLPTDKVFQTMIGIKMERLKQLVGASKTPNNESVDDTILDMANYAAIWLAYRRRRAESVVAEALIHTAKQPKAGRG